MSRERARPRPCPCSWPSALLACLSLAAAGCGGGEPGQTEAPPDTFHAMFSNGAGTNANTSALDLTFDASGSNNGTVTASAVYLVAGGTGAMTIIWSDGGSPERKIVIDTAGTPTAGQFYDTDALQGPGGDSSFTYQEGDERWDGTGTIVIDAVDQKSARVAFTADMDMQPDAASPGGAHGTFTVDVSSTTTVSDL